jgi:hypothetical protein
MKVFNRAIKLGGKSEKINSISVRVLEYDIDGNVLRCSGTTVPTGAGYAKGALFIKTDAASGTKALYENQGTTSAASFNLIGDISSAEISFANDQFVKDSNGNELIQFGVTASAVNHVKITNAATGNNALVSAVGGDDNINLELQAKGTGYIFIDGALYAGVTAKTSQNLIKGRLKLDVRPTGGTPEDYAFQIRSESAKTSDTHWGIDSETHLKATGTAAIRGVQGVAVVDATFTQSGGGLTGVYGQARADGTFNAAAAFMVGVYGLIEDCAAAVTASHVASIWADSHMAKEVTGEHELLYMSNNGSTKMDQVMYAYGDADALLHINMGESVPTYVTDTATTDGNSKKIAIKINGTTYYINAYAGA